MDIRMSWFSAPGNQTVLRYLGLLRKVQSVRFDTTTTSWRDLDEDQHDEAQQSGPLIESQYATHLKTLMQGKDPVDHLPNMYEALKPFVLPYVALEEAILRPKYERWRIHPPFARALADYESQGEPKDDVLSLKALLSDAETAMEEFDVEKFKSVREILVRAATARVANDAGGIYAKDLVRDSTNPVSSLGAALIAKGG